MNKRIQELAEEAWPNLDNDPRMIFSSMDVKRFAELIVQECANVLHDNELWNREISHVLNKHFGVEE